MAHRRQLERRPATDVKFEKWNIGTPDPQAVDRLREAGYSDLLSTVLVAMLYFWTSRRMMAGE